MYSDARALHNPEAAVSAAPRPYVQRVVSYKQSTLPAARHTLRSQSCAHMQVPPAHMRPHTHTRCNEESLPATAASLQVLYDCSLLRLNA